VAARHHHTTAVNSYLLLNSGLKA